MQKPRLDHRLIAILAAFVCTLSMVSMVRAQQENPLTLWYEKPAKECMNEALPIGNGRLGAMVMGKVDREQIVLNEDSLWTGDENPTGKYESMGGYQTLGSLYLAPSSLRMG
jgi:alpha-L-fucosidase 2